MLILLFILPGYIGGAVLERLLNHPDFARFQITAVVRSAEKAEKLNKLGVDVVVGSHSDADIVTDLAAKADVVFSIVSTLFSPSFFHASEVSSSLLLGLRLTATT